MNALYYSFNQMRVTDEKTPRDPPQKKILFVVIDSSPGPHQKNSGQHCRSL